jgi:hypothetical protein
MSMNIVPIQPEPAQAKPAGDEPRVIAWQNPPRSGRGKWNAVAAQLKANPNRWALIETNAATSHVHAINAGQIIAFQPAGTFQARSIGVDRNKNRARELYARYIGEEQL